MRELRDLYDINRKPTGKTFYKGEQVPVGFYYMIVIIIIRNSKGEYLIQKRSLNKGGRWALTGGHPKSGETSKEGIISEVKEEIGIDISKDNITLFEQYTHNDQLFDLYYVKKDFDISDTTRQVIEVDDIKWSSKEEIISMNEKDEFHLGHYDVFLRYLKYIGEK